MTTSPPPSTPKTDTTPRAGWRRPRQRIVVLAAVMALAVMTVGQGLAVERRAESLDSHRELASVSQSVTAESDDGLVQPLAPPALPTQPPVDFEVPQQQVQAELEPAPERTPNELLANLDLSPVETQRPQIRLEQSEVPAPDAVEQALAVEGVTFATAMEVGELPVASERGVTNVQVAAIDPNGFRVLTPQVTADAVEVWRRIAEGDAAFTHDIGTRLALELGSRVPAGESEGATLRVGAYASNGVPPVADAIVSKETAEILGLDARQTVLVAVAEGVDLEQAVQQLADATGMHAELIAEPQTRRAFLTGADARNVFEPFSYISIGDGMIQIDRDWVSRNIVSAQVPIFTGNVICHRLLIPQLRGALNEIVAQGLDHLIDPTQYGGCWVPRHILFNPSRALSMHAWGLAIDFNVRGNEYGNRNPEMDPRIVEIFERWGFVWGGHWSTPDGMHFELGAVLDGSDR
jgi:hypothetical protein